MSSALPIEVDRKDSGTSRLLFAARVTGLIVIIGSLATMWWITLNAGTPFRLVAELHMIESPIRDDQNHSHVLSGALPHCGHRDRSDR